MALQGHDAVKNITKRNTAIDRLWLLLNFAVLRRYLARTHACGGRSDFDAPAWRFKEII